VRDGQHGQLHPQDGEQPDPARLREQDPSTLRVRRKGRALQHDAGEDQQHVAVGQDRKRRAGTADEGQEEVDRQEDGEQLEDPA
jgi:hypothetical protein